MFIRVNPRFETFRYKFGPETNFLGRFFQKMDLSGPSGRKRCGMQRREMMSVKTKVTTANKCSSVLSVRREPKKPAVAGENHVVA